MGLVVGLVVMGPRAVVLFFTALGVGLVAGVFFAFSTFVMPGLARLPAEQGIAAMQAINVAAINRWFMTVLFGSGLFAFGLALTCCRSLDTASSRWIVVGALAYLGGALAVTMAANVPRNEALAVLTSSSSSSASSSAYWQRYLVEWTSWNHVRTVSSVVAAACFVLALSGCSTLAGIDRCADIPAARLSAAPTTLAKTGFVANGSEGPNEGGSGLIAFRPRFELWSEGATKERWLFLPAGAQIDTSASEAWRFPRGTKLWKRFSRDGVRVETRYMEKTGEAATDWLALSYVGSGEEAVAMPEGRPEANVPPASQCVACHGGVADRVLGISAVQLEPELVARLSREGRFTRPVGSVALPENPTDRAARGYLHANCAHCHNQQRPASSGPRCFDPESTIDLSLGHARFENVVSPGSPWSSALYRRVAGSPFFEPRMPALGTISRDVAGVALLRRWIEEMR